MKKIGKILFGIVVAAMLVTIVFYLYNNFIASPFIKNNVLQSDRKQAVTDKKNDTEEKVPVSANNAGILPYEKNTKNIKEPFKLLNEAADLKCGCVINDVTFTKEALDSDAAYYVADDTPKLVQFDDQYTILNDFTYVSVNMTIRNEKDRDAEIYMNSFRLLAINPETKDTADIYYGGELRGYKTKDDAFVYDKAYARKILAPNEEYTVNLVFVERESEMKDYIPYIKYYAAGAANPEYDKDSVYVRLRE